MAINAKNYKQAQELYSRLQKNVGSLAPDTFMYQRESEKLNRLRRSMDDFESSQRQTDEAGKLVTAPVHARVPASVGEPTDRPYNFHFEPSVQEVQQALRSDPTLANELALGDWVNGIAQEERVERVADPMTGQVSGQTVSPARTHLDNLTSGDSAYKAVSDRLWERRRQEAEASGEPVQRYRDVKLGDQPLQYLAGGAQYNIERRLAPAALGAADSFSAGQASPLYDAGRDLVDYEANRRVATPEHQQAVTDPTTGQAVGENTVPAERPFEPVDVGPSSQEVINRSPGMYVAGNVAGYASKLNPTNIATEGAIKGLGYAARGIPGRVGISAAVGAGVNTAEGAVGDFTRNIGQGQGPVEAAAGAASDAPSNFFFGGLGGGVFDAVGQTMGAVRQGYRHQERRRDLNIFEAGGGRTGPVAGVVPPPEVAASYDAAQQPGAIGTAGARQADQLAPEIDASLQTQASDEQARIQQQVQEYFNHPTYGSIEVPATPLLETLLQLAAPGRFRGPVTGEAMHIDPRKLKTIATEASNLSEVQFVPPEMAADYAHKSGGVPIDRELAVEFYGKGDEQPQNYVAIAVPRPLTARLLTELEERVYRELGISNNSAGRDDPVYRQLDRATKEMRDQFPYYTDEAGNLVEPPPQQSQAPFAPADDVPPAGPDGISVLPPPRNVGLQERPPMVREAEPGVGPGQPALPQNPFDASSLLPVSRARLEPNAPVEVRGGPVNRPEVVPPEAIPGIGQPRRQPRTGLGQDSAAVSAQPTQAVQGDYAKPPEIERAPDTQPMALDRSRITREPEMIPDEAVKSARPSVEPLEPREQLPTNMTLAQYEAMGGKVGVDLPPEIQARVDDGTLADEALQKERAAKAGYLGGESLPAPTAAEWADSTREAAEWTEDILAPGKDARSGEMKRMADLTQQQEAMDAARKQVDAIDKRLGPIPEDQKEEMVKQVMEARMRGMSKADIIKMLAPLGIGTAASAVTDDEDYAAAGVGGLALALGNKSGWSQEANALLDELGTYMSPDMLKKPGIAKAVVKDIGHWGLSPEESQALTDEVMSYHHKLQGEADLPTVAKDKQASKTYVSDLEMPSPESGRREIGDSLKLGPRYKGTQADAEALLKERKAELPPPPTATAPYKADADHARGYDLRRPNFAIKDLEVVSRRKYDELDGAEKHAVDTWLGNSRIMRNEQRNGIPLYTTGPKAPAFESAIDKLTVVNPTKHGTLYRRFYAEDPRELAELLTNDYYEAGASMSSGYFPNETFGPHELRFTKVDQAGSLLGVNSSEAEMIIPKGGRFRVTNRYFNKKTGGYVFELEEIPLTKENLLKEVGYLAVPFVAGAAADEATDGDGELAAAGAIVGTGAKRPKQLEAVLDDGTKVKGFSALRRNQHTEQETIERARKRVGAAGEETLPRRIQNFGLSKDNVHYDDAMLEEAKKIGKEKELRSAAAANVYPRLRDEAWLGGKDGVLNKGVDFMALRLDKPFEYMSGGYAPGHERNPFAREPNSLSGRIQRDYMSEPARRLMNLTGGRPGARFGDTIRELYEEEDRKQREKEKTQ